LQGNISSIVIMNHRQIHVIVLIDNEQIPHKHL
jgi:hypothetical protein